MTHKLADLRVVVSIAGFVRVFDIGTGAVLDYIHLSEFPKAAVHCSCVVH